MSRNNNDHSKKTFLIKKEKLKNKSVASLALEPCESLRLELWFSGRYMESSTAGP